MGFKKGTLLWQLLVCVLILLTVIAVKKMDAAIANQAVAFLETQIKKDYEVAELISEGKRLAAKGENAAKETIARISEREVKMGFPVDAEGAVAVWNGNSDLVKYESENEMQVYAVSGGTITKVTEENDGTISLKIEHGKDLSSVYQGCTEVYVQKLDKVKRGQIIGAVAAGKGNALRFQICEEGKSVNASAYLPVEKGKK